MTKKSVAFAATDPDELWAPVQVAAHLGMTYQDARNAMLEGRFGESQYDAKTRRLTVLASRVRDAKRQRDARRKSRKKSRRKPASKRRVQ